MSTLFFLLSIFIGWQAWNLYNPAFSNPKLAVPSFVAGWLTGELAPHVIFWQAIVIAVFVLFGAVEGFFGALGFLLCIAAWATMAFYYYEATGTRAEVQTALSEALGESFETMIHEDYRARFPEGPSEDLIRHPFRQHDPQISVIKDIPFGDFGQTLDLRQAKISNHEQPKPVLLQIHGGAWTQNYGSKNEQALPLMNHIAKQDWICVTSSYRLSPKATFPEHIIDCKQALVWIKEHIEEYGGDPDFIVVTGGSAGGHLSSLLALSANQLAFQPGFEDKDTSVQGAVPFYGVYDFSDSLALNPTEILLDMLEDSVMKLDLSTSEAAFRDASPLFHINDQAPPFLVVHGDRDTLTPVEYARVFVDELKKISNNEVAYIETVGAQHAFDMFPSVRSEHVKHGVEKFLTWTHSRYLNSQ